MDAAAVQTAIEAAGDLEVRDLLGTGGTGEVWSAWDRGRQREVAVKVLLHPSAQALRRFKAEFRQLAARPGPGRVALHELREAEGLWLLLMSRAHGDDFFSALRPPAPPGLIDETRPLEAAAPTLARQLPSTDRVRAAAVSVAEAVLALHRSGLRHGDLKPANVLLSPEGGVTLLDFGLASALEGEEPEQKAWGTPAYVAPERGQAPGSAAEDWYAVGAMLYEVVVGDVPFGRDSTGILDHKRRTDPPRAGALVPSLDPELDALIMGLLDRDPARRAGGEAILRWAGGEAPSSAPSPVVAASLTGRQAEVAELASLLDEAAAGNFRSVCVRGRSGLGKSTLVQHFLAAAADQLDDVWVLDGRCFEKESIPFKALDPILDRLATLLASLPPAERERLLPVDLPALARLFPAFGDLATDARGPPAPTAPEEQRRRGIQAFRELMGRVAQRRVVVLALDDAQWGDTDSLDVLAQLATQPAPAVLCLWSFRAEEADAPFPAGLVGLAPDATRHLSLSPLDDAAAGRLARAWGIDEGDVTTVVEEAGGNPLHLEVLARTVRGGEGTLDDRLARWVQDLSDDARATLELLAVADRPLADAWCRQALGASTADAGLEDLRRDRLIVERRADDGGHGAEPFHDGLRRAALACSSREERMLTHQVLAALYADHGHEAERVARHLEAAGERLEAARSYAEAAHAALEGLAFDQAAALFGAALALTEDHDTEGRRRLLIEQGDAWVVAGRGAEAADAWLAADTLGAPDADLRRRAASQLLMAGHLERGERSLLSAARELGIPERGMPKSVWTFGRLLKHVSAVGGEALLNEGVSVTTDEQRRADVALAGALGFANVNLNRAVPFTVSFVSRAFALGDPMRVLIALGLLSKLVAIRGRRKERAVLSALSGAIADVVTRADHPAAPFLADRTQAWVAMFSHQWPACVDAADRAEAGLREHAHAEWKPWWVTTLGTLRLVGLRHLGQRERVLEQARRLLAEARSTGNPLLEAWADVEGFQVPRLLGGAAQEGVDALTEHRHQFRTLTGGLAAAIRSNLAELLVAVDRPTEALAVLHDDGQNLLRRQLGKGVRYQRARIDEVALRAELQLAHDPERGAKHPVGAAHKLIQQLDVNATDVMAASASWGRASLAWADGDDSSALEHGRRAVEAYARSAMALHEMSVRLHCARLQGGQQGADEAKEARDRLAEAGAADPDAIARVLAPAPI